MDARRCHAQSQLSVVFKGTPLSLGVTHMSLVCFEGALFGAALQGNQRKPPMAPVRQRPCLDSECPEVQMTAAEE